MLNLKTISVNDSLATKSSAELNLFQKISQTVHYINLGNSGVISSNTYGLQSGYYYPNQTWPTIP